MVVVEVGVPPSQNYQKDPDLRIVLIKYVSSAAPLIVNHCACVILLVVVGVEVVRVQPVCLLSRITTI